MSMKDKHEYIDESGYKWNRVFTCPQMSVDTEINPFNEREFVEKTKLKKNLTVGDTWDISAELSKKRERLAGKDFIKEKTELAYRKKTDKDHPLAKERVTSYTITKNPKKK